MPTMSVSDNFDRHVLPLSPRLWTESADERSFMHHGTGRCPQRLHPFAGQIDERLCDRCSELHHHTMIVADRRFSLWFDQRLGAGDSPCLAATTASERVVKNTTSVVLEARDQYDASRGLVTKVSQIPDRATWFVGALPDPMHQQIAQRLVFFARGGDCFKKGRIPVDVIAEGLGLDTDAASRHLDAAVEALREVKPEWVERNIDLPLSERFTELGSLDHGASERLTDESPTFEDDLIEGLQYRQPPTEAATPLVGAAHQ